MESQQEFLTEEEQVSKNVWNTVTPLSKYLAMTLFIVMPFVGGWIGYNFAPEKIVEVERVIVREAEKEISKSYASSDEELLTAIYGDSGFIWNPSESDRSKLSEQYYNNRELPDAWNVEILSRSSMNDKVYVVTKATNNNLTAHVYGAVIGFHILLDTETELELISSQPAEIVMGSFGDLTGDAVQELPLSNTVMGYVFEPKFTGQGYTLGTTLLFAERDSGFQKVLEIKNSYEDNLGTLDEEKYVITTNVIANKNEFTNELYDLRVVRLSTSNPTDRDTDNEVSGEVYKFNGSEYLQVDSN